MGGGQRKEHFLNRFNKFMRLNHTFRNKKWGGNREIVSQQTFALNFILIGLESNSTVGDFLCTWRMSLHRLQSLIRSKLSQNPVHRLRTKAVNAFR